jgi:pullulanase/glycogen debranching enzyme
VTTKVYERGGKVWTGKNGQGLVFLEKDWENDRLPEDLVEEAGHLGTDFNLLEKIQRAKLAGYAIYGNVIRFSVDPIADMAGNQKNTEIYVACDLNNWLQGETNTDQWKLNMDEMGLLTCSIDINKLSLEDRFSFKFKSSDGHWLGPADFFPSQEESMPGVSNFIFDIRRTGEDILSFRVIEEDNSQALSNWTFSRPENLGYSEAGDEGTFRLFAPRAHQVSLKTSNETEFSNNQVIHKMIPGDDGVWESKVKKPTDNLYYGYEVTHKRGSHHAKSFTKQVLDPYAKSCINREGPGLICSSSFRATEYSTVSFSAPEAQDLVIMEGHVRDLLKYAPLDLPESERLGFRGLSKWLESEDCYLRKIGINAVELQPIHQFDSRSRDEYHWGYMPVNFFSPASDYATKPENAAQECRELVAALHKANIAVILDVVYNHFGIPNHLLYLDRELYLSTDELGRLTNYSGCGNDLNCDAEPVKKMIIDSLKYWVSNYQIDGFRFDLAELLGTELLAEIEFELKKLNPNIILIAEPWSFRGRLPEEINQTGYSLWSDRCRESLLAFVREGAEKDKISSLLQGKLDPENFYPWQSLQYIESHDDYAFIDRICSDSKTGGMYPPKNAIEQAKLAMIILLLSPGIPMISAGQDFLRSKQGIRNTYQNGDVNALNYQRLEKYKNVHVAICEVIKFRKSKQGLFTRPKAFGECSYSEIEVGCADIFNLVIRHNQAEEEYLFLCNPHQVSNEVELPLHWQNQEIMLPGSSELNQITHLEPFEYRLIKRTTS